MEIMVLPVRDGPQKRLHSERENYCNQLLLKSSFFICENISETRAFGVKIAWFFG